MDTSIVKVGGSLAAQPENLRILCKRLSDLSREHRLIVIPGGGEFADAVRKLDRRFSLSPSISHQIAILGMDQYGMLLSDLTPNSHLVNNFEELEKTSASGKLPIFLPSAFLLNENPLENSWAVTSDSIALHIAWRLHAARTLLLTDVNGVYNCDPKKFPEAKLVRKLSARDLLRMKGRTSVDGFLPRLLLQLQADCYVVNGLFPERVEAILNGQQAVSTLILGKP